MKTRRKNMIFFLAVGLLILSIVYRLQHPYVQPRVTRLTYTDSVQPLENKKDSRAKKPESSMDPGELGSLKRVKTSPRMYQDLFALYRPPEMSRKEKEIVAVPEESSAAVEKNPMGQVKDYIASYRYYGSYRSGGKKAVFLAKDKLVLVAGIGDRIDGKYLIDEIQDDFIRIKALELNETIDIHIGEFNDD